MADNPRLEWFNRARLARFFAMVQITPLCWNWTGGINGKGYGIFRSKSAHRFTYSWFVESIAAGLEVDHLCRNIRCVNPAHLEAVTPAENRRRAVIARTHCRSGHAFAQFGRLYIRRNGKRNRWCRECHRLQQRRFYWRVGRVSRYGLASLTEVAN